MHSAVKKALLENQKKQQLQQLDLYDPVERIRGFSQQDDDAPPLTFRDTDPTPSVRRYLHHQEVERATQLSPRQSQPPPKIRSVMHEDDRRTSVPGPEPPSFEREIPRCTTYFPQDIALSKKRTLANLPPQQVMKTPHLDTGEHMSMIMMRGASSCVTIVWNIITVVVVILLGVTIFDWGRSTGERRAKEKYKNKNRYSLQKINTA